MGNALTGLGNVSFPNNPLANPSGQELDAIDRYLVSHGGRAAGIGAPDAGFQQAILNALAYRGIDTSQMSPSDLDALVNQYWSDPSTQRTYLAELAKAADPSVALRGRVGPTVPSQNLAQPVPLPWAVGGEAISGYGFGAPDPDYGPGGVHPGADYNVPSGTTLTSPFAGTVTYVNDGQSGLGFHAILSFGNGWRMIFGHMQVGGMQVGVPIKIQAGQSLGASDATGNVTGPHVHFEVHDPQGAAVDPKTLLDPIFKGTTYAQLLAQLPQLGSGIVGSPLTQAEATVDPSFAELQRRAQPSHIPGMNVGQYEDLLATVNPVFSKVYGYRPPDSVIQDLFNKGQISPAAVQYEVDQMPFQPGKSVPPIVFNQVYGSAAAFEAGIWNQTPHPLTLQAIWQQAGSPTTVPATQSQQLAQSAKPNLSVVQGGQ